MAEMVLKATMDLFGQSELAEMITGPNIVNLKTSNAGRNDKNLFLAISMKYHRKMAENQPSGDVFRYIQTSQGDFGQKKCLKQKVFCEIFCSKWVTERF